MVASSYRSDQLSSFRIFTADICAGILRVGNTVFADRCLITRMNLDLTATAPEDVVLFCPGGESLRIPACPEYTGGSLELTGIGVNPVLSEALGARQAVLNGPTHVASKLATVGCLPTFVEIGVNVLPEVCAPGVAVPQCVYHLYQVAGWVEVSSADIDFNTTARDRIENWATSSFGQTRYRGSLQKISPQTFRNMAVPNVPSGELAHYATSWPAGASGFELRTDPINCLAITQTTAASGPRAYI